MTNSQNTTTRGATKPSFTPGPWRFVESPDSSRICDKEKACLAVAYALRRDVDGTEEEANARLIAAAPELYEALMLALPYVESALEDQGYKPGVVDRMTKTIRAALALVDGEKTEYPTYVCPVCESEYDTAQQADECEHKGAK